MQTIIWQPLESIATLDKIEKNSFDKDVLIFKHSTRCGISRMALKAFEADFSIPADKLDLYFLDLLSFRSVSNEIATKFSVEHQSPQILLIRNGKCIYSATHSDISASGLASVISS